METKTINKNNWSGESITYKAGKRILKLPNGYKIKLKKFDKEIIKIFWTDSNNFNLLCTAFLIGGVWYASSMGVERESKFIDELAVEMFCNLV